MKATAPKARSASAVAAWLLAASILPPATVKSAGTPAERTDKAAPTREIQESPVVTSQLLDIVQAYIEAGSNKDPGARARYLAPKVFYYGQTRTREQAIREMETLYRRWPLREYTPTDSIALYKIPNRPPAYRITAIYQYKFENPREHEHLSGLSQLTFVIENAPQGARIIGIDEHLVSGSTHYSRD